MLYSIYAEHAKLVGEVPMSAVEFQDTMDVEIARSLAAKMNPADEDIALGYYLTRRQDGGRHAPDTIDGKCDRCGEKVYIDKTMAKLAFKAKQIICNECLPEVSGGLTMGEIISKRLEELK
jgi:hypothetical protein